MNGALDGKTAVVAGAGIVGLCCGLALQQAGARVVLVDPKEPGNEASHGNAGCFAIGEVLPMSMPGLWRQVPGWLLDPLGPLSIRPAQVPRLVPWMWRFLRSSRRAEVARISAALFDLMSLARTRFPALLDGCGLNDHLQQTGVLTVYETARGLAAGRAEWARAEALGVPISFLDSDGVAEAEPALGKRFAGAVLTSWGGRVSDPYELLLALLAVYRQRGGEVVCDRVTSVAADRLQTASGTDYPYDVAVVASGAWSGRLAAGLGVRVLLESERGYNTTLPNAGIQLNHPVAAGEAKFFLNQLSSGLRIGGAAEFAGLSAPPNYARARALLTIAKRFLPDMNTEGGREWMGHRPSTPDSLPVIDRAPRYPNVFLAFGHGHLGLTGAAATGDLIVALACGATPAIDLAPFRATRFQ